jgi:hypothetical protein
LKEKEELDFLGLIVEKDVIEDIFFNNVMNLLKFNGGKHAKTT